MLIDKIILNSAENANVAEFEKSESLMFSAQELVWATDLHQADSFYQQIVYKVLRRPLNLTGHVERIFYCYRQSLQEQLYAAIIDLLIVLDGKGIALSKRMIFCSKLLLDAHHYQALSSYLKNIATAILPSNKFCVLHNGIIGSSLLVIESADQGVEPEYDALFIARDFIEFSQLNEAKATLETAVLAEPDRQDIQVELLELYKVTRDQSAFVSMYRQLKDHASAISGKWDDLSKFFNVLENEK